VSYLPLKQAFRLYQMYHMVQQQFILDFLDTRPEVLNWYSLPPSNILIVSRSDLAALTGLVHVSFPWLYFTLAEVDSHQVNGWMNTQVWDFIANPKSSGRWGE